MNRRLTAVIQRDGDGFVALCPELDIASQGNTIETARENLQEAVQLFVECASPAEIQIRLRDEVFVTQVEVAELSPFALVGNRAVGSAVRTINDWWCR